MTVIREEPKDEHLEDSPSQFNVRKFCVTPLYIGSLSAREHLACAERLRAIGIHDEFKSRGLSGEEINIVQIVDEEIDRQISEKIIWAVPYTKAPNRICTRSVHARRSDLQNEKRSAIIDLIRSVSGVSNICIYASDESFMNGIAYARQEGNTSYWYFEGIRHQS